MHATAWTVFSGSQPEPMDVEILGVLKNARGPGEDMILAQLHGQKPEYTGVVAGMSGSPVYIGDRLVGALAYRIGQFSKDPIAGITPIAQMLEVRDLPAHAEMQGAGSDTQESAAHPPATAENFQAMETPLVMSGFRPEAMQLWRQKMAGTGLESVFAGGSGATTGAEPTSTGAPKDILPGSAVSALLVRGDLEVAATCTVTYVDPHQLLACGHPLLQSGQVSLPMTRADVVATLASPLNAFKIVNTGAEIGAFTEDRDASIRGVFGASARMIPVHLAVRGEAGERKLNFDVLDLAGMTPQALMVAVYNALLQNNASTAALSYHLTGEIRLKGYATAPLDLWAPSGDTIPASMGAALLLGERFNRIYSSSSRMGRLEAVELHIEEIPRSLLVDLESARLIGSNLLHAGDTVEVEATVRAYQQERRNVRLRFRLPARLEAGNLRVLVSDSGTLDRTLNQPRASNKPLDLANELAQMRRSHAADRVYVSLLTPETQAGLAGRTLTGLPLSMANAMENTRTGQDINLNGESAEEMGSAPAFGFLLGYQILNLHIDTGGGLH